MTDGATTASATARDGARRSARRWRGLARPRAVLVVAGLLLSAAFDLPPGRAQELGLAPAAPAVSSHRAPAKDAGHLRLLQLNVWQEGTKVSGGFEKIVDVIIASGADVVALSEVRNYGGKDLHQRLVAALGANGHTFHGTYAGGDAGLLSLWPIVGSESVVDFTAEDHGCVIAWRLRPPKGAEILVASAHLDYTHYAVYLPRGYDGSTFAMIDADGDGRPDPVTDLDRIRAVDAASLRDEALDAFVAYAAKQPPALPVILAGDLNACSHLDWTAATAELFSHNGVVIDWRDSLMLKRAGFRDAWRELYPDPVTHPGATWPSDAWERGSTSWAPRVDERDRIDFVYYRGPHLRARRAWLVGSPRYWVRGALATPNTACPFVLQDLPWPSDHKGLLVDFALE